MTAAKMVEVQPSTSLDVREAERFLYYEARLLDERRFEEWRGLFTDDGTYWAPTRHDQASPDEAVSLFFDDQHLMAARIRRLTRPDAHVQAPISRTVHLVSNVEVVEPAAPDEARACSALVMAEWRDQEPRWYAARVEHRLRRTDGQLRIVRKTVTLVNCAGAFTAMAVYF